MSIKENDLDFEPGDISDIYDKLAAHSFALRAFGSLLKTSDLSDFADTGPTEIGKAEAVNLRWGLSQIIELYLGHQERILSEHLEEYKKADPALLVRARRMINAIKQGAFKSPEVAVNELRDTIADLDIIIDRGGDRTESAEALKGTCLKYIEQLTGKGKTATGKEGCK